MADGSRILLICEDENISRYLRQKLIVEGGYLVSCEGSISAGLVSFRKNGFDLVIAKVKLDEDETREFIKALKKADPEVIIIVFIDEYKPEVEDLFGLGIYEYITKPINSEKLAFLVKKGLELRVIIT